MIRKLLAFKRAFIDDNLCVKDCLKRFFWQIDIVDKLVI